MGAAVRGPATAMPPRRGDPWPAVGADDDDDDGILSVHGLIKLIFI
jgi:hypothetical protein